MILYFEQSSLRFSKFFFQNTTIAIHISNCDYVAFNNPKLNELQLKEVSVKSVNEVRVGPKILKRVDKIFIENVNKLVLEESALESLESKSVQFVNCTFSPFTKNIKPSRIQSEFIFYRSTLPSNFEIYLKEQQSTPSLVIEACLIDRIQGDVNVTDFQMINNRFHQLPAKQSLNIYFTKFVSLTDNILMDSPNRPLPDVNTQGLIGEIKKNNILLKENSTNSFVEVFLFHFKGNPSESGSSMGRGRRSSSEATTLLLSTSQLITITLISIIIP